MPLESKDGSLHEIGTKLFKSFNLAYIERFPKTSISHADALATFTSTVELNMKRTIEVEFLPRPSIEADQDCNTVFDVEVDLEISRITQ